MQPAVLLSISGFTFINEIQSIGTSNYNALQATLRVSNLHGLTAQAAYTWSHSFDEVTAYRGALPQDSFNFKGDYGPSDFDNRNIFVGSVHLRRSRSAEVEGAHQGWQLNSLMTFHGGLPFSVYSSADTSGTNDGNQRANFVPASIPMQAIARAGSALNWLNPAAFVDARLREPGATPGATPTMVLAIATWTSRSSRTRQIGERVTTQFRVEMFNLFNRTNFAPPLNGSFNPSFTQDNALNLFTTIGSFNGAPGIGAGEPFNTQFALKIIF